MPISSMNKLSNCSAGKRRNNNALSFRNRGEGSFGYRYFVEREARDTWSKRLQSFLIDQKIDFRHEERKVELCEGCQKIMALRVYFVNVDVWD